MRLLSNGVRKEGASETCNSIRRGGSGRAGLSVAALLWATTNSSAAFEGNSPGFASYYGARVLLAVTWFPVNILVPSPSIFSGIV